MAGSLYYCRALCFANTTFRVAHSAFYTDKPPGSLLHLPWPSGGWNNLVLVQSLLELSDILGHSFLPLDPDVKIHRQARQLADYLRDSETPTEAGAAKVLQVANGGSAYRKIKHVLKYAYINGITAVYSHDRNSEDRQKIYEYAWKHLSIGMSYRLRPQTSLVVPYLKEALEVAERHDIPEVAALAAASLRNAFANKKFDAKLYNKYANLTKQYESINHALSTMIRHTSHMNHLRNSQAKPNIIFEYSQESCNTARQEFRHIEHTRTIGYIFYNEMVGYMAISDFKNAITSGENGLAYLDTKDNTSSQMYQIFEVNLSSAFMQLGDYKLGIKFAERLLAKTSENTYNYIKAYELMIILAFRSKNYQAAYTYYLQIVKAGVKKRLLSIFRETFDIFEAYIYILIKVDLISRSEW